MRNHQQVSGKPVDHARLDEVDMLRVDAYLDFGRLKLKVTAVDDVRGDEFCILAELLAAFLFKGLGLLRAHAVVFE